MPFLNHEDFEWAEAFPGVRGKRPVVRQSGAGALTLGVIEVAPGAVIPPHTHKVEEAVWILQGSGEGRVGNERQQLRAGMTMLAPANTVHALRNTGQDTWWPSLPSPPRRSSASWLKSRLHAATSGAAGSGVALRRLGVRSSHVAFGHRLAPLHQRLDGGVQPVGARLQLLGAADEEQRAVL